jgi:hypothetical protein
MNSSRVVLLTAGVCLLAGQGSATIFDPLFNTRLDYQVGNSPIFVVAADFDGDGDIDLAVANYDVENFDPPDSVSILKNNGNGTYAPAASCAVGTHPLAVCAVDFDRDGDIDLAVLNGADQSFSFLRNYGNGTFMSAVDYDTELGSVWSLSAADFDGDGRSDLAVTGSGGGDRVLIFKNIGNANFTVSVDNYLGYNIYPHAACTADFDTNGTIDLALACQGGILVLKNTGNGTFGSGVTYPAGSIPLSVFAVDFEGDGCLDLAAANYGSANVSILRNNGDGTFAAAVNYGVGAHPYSLCAVDVDGDAKEDLAIANYDSDNVSILRNNGDSTFAAAVNWVVGGHPRSVCAVDVDGDAKNDLAVANYNSGSVSVLKNDGPGTFASAVKYELSGTGYYCCSADFDGDGKIDLAVGGGALSVLRNNGDGTFAAAAQYLSGIGRVCSADFDGDGSIDLAAVKGYPANMVAVLINAGNGTFPGSVTYAVGTDPEEICTGDFNGDGKPDLAVKNCYCRPPTFCCSTISILINDGTGAFLPDVEYSLGGDTAGDLCAADIDGNGSLDLAVTTAGVVPEVQLLRNNGSGAFAKAAVLCSLSWEPDAISAADFNGDGATDLATTMYSSNNVAILMNNGDGTYANAVYYGVGVQPYGVVVADFSADGKPDVAVSNRGCNNFSVLVNNGDGTFVPAIGYGVGGHACEIDAADYDGDGKLDAAVTGYSPSAIFILMNIHQVQTGTDETVIPPSFSVSQNYPNPFNPSTVIEFNVPRATNITLRIYDVAGRAVRTLVSGYQSSGRKRVEWNGRDDGGKAVASGVYFYRLSTGNFCETRKIVLVK